MTVNASDGEETTTDAKNERNSKDLLVAGAIHAPDGTRRRRLPGDCVQGNEAGRGGRPGTLRDLQLCAARAAVCPQPFLLAGVRLFRCGACGIVAVGTTPVDQPGRPGRLCCGACRGGGAAGGPDGGVLIAHRALNAVQRRFQELGGHIETGRVASLDSANTSIRLDVHAIDGHSVDAAVFDQAVICAGPWTGKLLPQLAPWLESVATPVTYWRDPSGAYSASSGFPIIFNARLTGIYGLPSCEYPGLVKILYHGGPEADPDLRDRASLTAHIARAQHYVTEYLPLLDNSKPAILETCMYTMTPDGTPIIDRLGDKAVVGCGFSGSGFKHAPATGWMLAMMALRRQQEIPEGFRTDRYELSRLQK